MSYHHFHFPLPQPIFIYHTSLVSKPNIRDLFNLRTNKTSRFFLSHQHSGNSLYLLYLFSHSVIYTKDAIKAIIATTPPKITAFGFVTIDAETAVAGAAPVTVGGDIAPIGAEAGASAPELALNCARSTPDSTGLRHVRHGYTGRILFHICISNF